MKKIKALCNKLVTNSRFELFIILVIITNSVLIGVETYGHHAGVKLVQNIILGIFTFEILARFIAADNIKSFFKSAWNNFDLFLVLISFIPETLFESASMIIGFRVLRVFRVLRLLRTSGEIKLIISVLMKSFSALFYNGIFFFIFLYLFAIMGVSLFHLPQYDTLTPEKQELYDKYMEVAPNTPVNSPDPYGTLGESMFTLFRALTGEDWTDLRYNLLIASEYGLVHVNTAVITGYHVIWFILSAFLLLNLVVGAIINNYQIIMEQTRRQKEKMLEEYNPMQPDKNG